MHPKSTTAAAPGLDEYLALFRLYQGELARPAESRGQRFTLLFEQVARLLDRPSPFNHSLPKPFREVAARYLAGDAATHRHFRYDENRHFFLSDLHDYLRLRAWRQERSGG